MSRANPFLHQLQDPQPEGMPRCASHDRIDERVAIGLLCLQHQVMARQEAICWTVALLQQQPALVRSDNCILARLALGRRSRAGKCLMSMATFYPAETSLSAGGCDNPMICAACRARPYPRDCTLSLQEYVSARSVLYLCAWVPKAWQSVGMTYHIQIKVQPSKSMQNHWPKCITCGT